MAPFVLFRLRAARCCLPRAHKIGIVSETTRHLRVGSGIATGMQMVADTPRPPRLDMFYGGTADAARAGARCENAAFARTPQRARTGDAAPAMRCFK